MKKNKKPRAITFVTISQSIFLTVKYFLQNRLLSYAGSCSFSFLFSFIPVFMMIVMVLVSILHTSPEMIKSILSVFPGFEKYFTYNSLLNSIATKRGFSSFEILVGFFIFWMARRFFASIFDAMQNIFHSQIKRKALINQILTFVIEAVIIVSAAAIIFAYISLRTVLSSPFFTEIFSNSPKLSFIVHGFLSTRFMGQIPNIVIFVMLVILFRYVSGSKPSRRISISAAFLCTVSFWIFRIIMHLFLNVGRYNLIYGVLGQVIITLMDVFFFFTFFLFFAQFIFVIQFFDELLLGELYLLPKKEETGKIGNIKRSLFIRPHFLIATEDLIRFKKDEIIYSPGSEPDGTYYVNKGRVKLNFRDIKSNYFTRGDFFGEVDCILGSKHEVTATAEEDCELVKIDDETFNFLVHQNPDAGRKALGKLSVYFH